MLVNITSKDMKDNKRKQNNDLKMFFKRKDQQRENANIQMPKFKVKDILADTTEIKRIMKLLWLFADKLGDLKEWILENYNLSILNHEEM